MLQVPSDRRLEEIGNALCMRAPKHGVAVLAVTHLGKLLQASGAAPPHDAMVYTICQTELYTALLAADPRFAAYLPCRLAAIRTADGVLLETMSPKKFCELISRPDLDRLAAPLEDLLKTLMMEVAVLGEDARGAIGSHGGSHIGAVENQVSHQAAIPQRIDCHGTKVEDIAGTGKTDAFGG